jgi:hypothetical protein
VVFFDLHVAVARQGGVGKIDSGADWRVLSSGPVSSPTGPATSHNFLTSPKLHRPPRLQTQLYAIAASRQLLSLTPRGDTYLDKMFRNALRQSTRAVGALSASSRVAAVSAPPPARPDPDSIARCSHPISIGPARPGEAQLSSFAAAHRPWASIGSLDGQLLNFACAFGARGSLFG